MTTKPQQDPKKKNDDVVEDDDIRDELGLLPKDKYKSEQQVRSFYFKMTATVALIISPILSGVLYFVMNTMLFPNDKILIRSKLQLLKEYDLLWVYVGYYVIMLGRTYATINANGARGPARVGRPDQHVYKIMSTNGGTLANAPYVMMVSDTSSSIGRFNRAQRAAFNLDEQLPSFLAGFLLQGYVFGKLSLVIAILWFYGAISYSNLYKKDAKVREGGFLFCILATYCNSSLVLMVPIMSYYDMA